MFNPLQERQNRNEAICWAEFLRLVDAKKSPARIQPSYGTDHGKVFRTKDGQRLMFDNPYIPSDYLDAEPRLIADGWQVLHLPVHMSWYVAGKCQPRLLAPPGSKADLAAIALVLERVGYVGNFALTQRFARDGGIDADWQRRWSTEILARRPTN